MLDAPRPLLVFDGDCGFCRAWVARWRRAIDGHVDVQPSQTAAASHPGIPAARFAESVVLIEPGGEVRTGAAAVFRALACAPGRGLAWRAYRGLPGFAALSEAAYGWVARHRGAAAAVTRALWGAHVLPPGERATAWLFVRLVGAVFLMAFASLATQLPGLVGRDGILPAAGYLAQLATHYGPERFLLLPSLAWLDASDPFLMGLCVAGMAASLLVVLGVAQRAMLLCAWAAYLSLANLGGEFMLFQWDGLLLECGVVAALLAPWGMRAPLRGGRAPARAAVWLSRWVLFRLVFSSAVVKLASGDPAWHRLTALRFHYETQPLPPWPAWYAFHLPAGFQSFSALLMFVIEGLLPLLVIAPRRVRMAAGAGMAFLQALIVLTGNYGFFNWLTLALCVMLMDDGAWPRWFQRAAGAGAFARAGDAGGTAERARAGAPRRVAALAIALGVIGATPLLESLRVPPAWLGPLPVAYEVAVPLRVVNAYGLFAVMTTRRLEIQLEGSDDGAHWRVYEFRYKPGDPLRRPGFVPAHMPRLDWQMWFAALAPERPAYWFLRFARQVLAGSRPVLGLLGRNPFPGRPPRYLRASLFEYHFTSPAQRVTMGAWWTREPVGTYLPPVRLAGGDLVSAPAPADTVSPRSEGPRE